MKRIFSFVMIFLLALSMVALASAPQKHDVEVAVREKRILDPTLRGLTLTFYLTLKNTTSSPRFLAKYDYRFIVEQSEYLKLQTSLADPIRIEPKGETVVALPVKITYEFLYREVLVAPDKDQLACILTGGMTFQDERRREKRIPVAFSGEFPIFRGLDVEIPAIESKNLTIGGADLIFTAILKNPNGFGFTLERLAYTLDLAGKTVSSGTLGRGTSIEGHGEKSFSTPLLLDFFEIGKEVYQGLDEPPVAVYFRGEAEVTTAWGGFKILFDKKAKAAVKKIS